MSRIGKDMGRQDQNRRIFMIPFQGCVSKARSFLLVGIAIIAPAVIDAVDQTFRRQCVRVGPRSSSIFAEPSQHQSN